MLCDFSDTFHVLFLGNVLIWFNWYCSCFAWFLSTISKVCLPWDHVLLQSQILPSLLRQTRQQWDSGRFRICQHVAGYGEISNLQGQSPGSEPPVLVLGLKPPWSWKPFVHFHTKDGPTVKELGDNQCAVSRVQPRPQSLLFVNGSGLSPG